MPISKLQLCESHMTNYISDFMQDAPSTAGCGGGEGDWRYGISFCVLRGKIYEFIGDCGGDKDINQMQNEKMFTQHNFQQTINVQILYKCHQHILHNKFYSKNSFPFTNNNIIHSFFK